MIPLFIRKIMAGEPLTIYGDGTQTRDFVFVTDLANGLIRAAETPGAGGEIFQLASGVETSLNDLVAMLAEVSGRQPQLQHEPPRAGEIQRNYSLVDKARDRLGHAPEVPLADGLARTWEWFQEQTDRLSGPTCSGRRDVDRHLVGLAHQVLGHLDRRRVDQLAVQRDGALALGRRLLHRLEDPAGAVDLGLAAA